MSDVNTKQNNDFEDLSDEDFNKLNPDSILQEMNKEEEKEVVVSPENLENDDTIVPTDDVTDPVDKTVDEPLESEDAEKTEEKKSSEELSDEEFDKTELPGITKTDQSNEQVDKPKAEDESETEDKKTEKPAKTDDKKVEDTKVVSTESDGFMNKILAPFKANGEDHIVRSAEDAIRLMQMGVNYSSKMAELKPLKVMQATLKLNGLDDPNKLNELIDISKGNPEAIRGLLKRLNIDPIDIDTTKDSNYTPKDHSADPSTVSFKDAVDSFVKSPNGPEILRTINAEWDDSSKELLQTDTNIFNNLLAQKESGVYDKIIAELKYQKNLGHLTEIPYLQAYNEVGSALDKIGAFKDPDEIKTEVQSKTPLDTGPKPKVAPEPKTEQPNPISSITQPRVSPNDTVKDELDYSSMSDADFNKLSIPA